MLHYSHRNKFLSDGFTLNELITVIAVIGILSSIAIPAILSWLPDIRLKAAARILYSDMQEARLQAVRQNKDWAIIFDTGNNRYHICSDRGADNDWSGVNDDTGEGDNVISKTVSLKDYKSGVGYGSGSVQPEMTVTYTSKVATFNRRGTCKSGYVYLEHEKQRETLRVGTLSSGIIKIARWRENHWE